MKDQNNSHYATSYRALEQNFRLRERYKKFNIFNSDTFILTLNKITNNHGTQPFYALINLFLLIGCYYLALTKELSLNESNINALYVMKSNIGYFFKPLTFISDIESVRYNFSFGFRLWDILYKILYSYLVFQFIAAFRKFNKWFNPPSRSFLLVTLNFNKALGWVWNFTPVSLPIFNWFYLFSVLVQFAAPYECSL